VQNENTNRREKNTRIKSSFRPEEHRLYPSSAYRVELLLANDPCGFGVRIARPNAAAH
jgi:hypothetical protein